MLTIALAMTATSCIGSSDNPSQTQTVTGKGYNHVYTAETGESFLTPASYALTMDLTNMVGTLQFAAAYEQGGSAVTLMVENLPLSYNSTTGAISFSVAEATPSESAGMGSLYKITNLKGSLIAYTTDGTTATTVLQVSYTVAGQHNVYTVIQSSSETNPCNLYTNCSTTTSGAATPFTTTVTTFNVSFASASSANITINNAQFAKQMPQMTMTLEGLELTPTQLGYTVKAESVIPKISGVPFPDYKISNFRADVTGSGTIMNLSFNCTVADVQYTTTAYCKLLPDATQQ